MSNKEEVLAQSYGRALFEIILEHGETAAVETQLGALASLNSGELGDFLDNPVFEKSEKEQVIEELSAKLELKTALDRFLRILVKQKHFQLMPHIRDKFVACVRDQENKMVAHIDAAQQISDADQKRIAETLGKKVNKEIILDVHLDPTLIGGVKARIGSMVFDGTIAGQLKRLSEETQK